MSFWYVSWSFCTSDLNSSSAASSFFDSVSMEAARSSSDMAWSFSISAFFSSSQRSRLAGSTPLEKFVKESLKPVCSPANLDLCDDEKKAEIEKLQAMSDEDLAASIETESKKLEAAEEEFKSEVQKLQETYQKLMEDKDNKIADP
eukprot:CAMPEP_0113539756 /NCGR_PEP_ID=MMETSP0015_2-20120614/8102_1 /TAXON_ID=2838 /ORGANISM="Odontella" /LENGTH=145 /DNA_ID=CAMNT_0000439485 /DNA_START=706 /DNA_END=1144 /DNA_ORIENTATION=+ /assembly_acc=CAM_ASM_000160